MSGEEKSSIWSFGETKRQAAGVGAEDLSLESKTGEILPVIDGKPSAEYDVVQIAPVERFNCVFKSGQKFRVTCWVMLRHRKTNEIVITGAISNPGSNGRMTLAIDMADVDRFSAM